MDRRHLLATAAGAFAASIANQAQAYKGTVEQHLGDPKFLKDHATRFIDLDTEGLMDFNGQYTKYIREFLGGDESYPDRAAFLKANGYPMGPVETSHEECFNIMLQYPPYAAHIRLARTIHEQMWDRALRSLRRHEDLYLSAMEATDKTGHLELNRGLVIPEYACHEIHEQPGGYVGDELAGMLYHYAAVTAFYHGLANGPVNHDERNQIMVAEWGTPPDKKIKRILEVGTSHGSTTIALRERFDDKDIEVWGLDVAAPQVRYAHNRAQKMGHDIKFVQRLAEDTGFPDNYFDIIAINLLFHEVPSSITRKIIPELSRITRPGGVWVGDASTQGGPRQGTILQKARTWAGHRWNFEVWTLQNNTNDFPVLRKAAGWVQNNATGKSLAMKA